LENIHHHHLDVLNGMTDLIIKTGKSVIAHTIDHTLLQFHCAAHTSNKTN